MRENLFTSTEFNIYSVQCLHHICNHVMKSASLHVVPETDNGYPNTDRTRMLIITGLGPLVAKCTKFCH